jgi:hypothetical protein
MQHSTLSFRRHGSSRLGAATRSRFGLGLCLVALFPLVLSCSAEPDSPEARIRALLERAELGAEEKDVDAMMELVSIDYKDAAGRRKHNIHGLLAFYFLRNQSIHLLTRVQEITFPEPEQSEVTVLVAMAGRPIESASDLIGIRSSLYRFDFALTDEGDGEWKVHGAEWKPAQREDFF